MTEMPDDNLIRRRQRVGIGLLIILVAALGVLLAGQYLPLGVDKSQNDELRHDNYEERVGAYEGCLRANTARVAQIDILLGIARGNEARSVRWHELAEQGLLPPDITAFAKGMSKVNAREADRLRMHVDELAAAQAPVSQHPDAGPRRLTQVDCEAVFPVPKEPDDPLPAPSLP
jgi:hypothetical protein